MRKSKTLINQWDSLNSGKIKYKDKDW